jgi:hypothetical protein
VRDLSELQSNSLHYSRKFSDVHCDNYYKTLWPLFIHSPAPRCGTIASVTFILWRVKQAANKMCWLASMCKYNTQGSSTLWNYSKCGVYTVESEAGC